MAKKKKSVSTASEEPAVEEQIEPEPAEELPVRQIEEPVEQPEEQVAQAEPIPIVEPAAKVEPQPVVEPTPPVEVVIKPVPPSKPKPLTLISLSGELSALRQIVDQQALLIKQLMEAPVKQRKPPLSNSKIQIIDTLTGKSYPSKNATYQELLKAGELKELVDKGLFGDNPYKNNYGCYILFRAFPGRFQEIKPEETKV